MKPWACRLMRCGTSRFWFSCSNVRETGQEDVMQRVADGAGPSLGGTKADAAA